MAVHEICPHPEPDNFDLEIVAGTALIAARCKMLKEDRCKSDGQTAGSQWAYCKKCSDYYKICEACGLPLDGGNGC